MPAWQGTRVRALELLRNYGVRADYGVGFVQRLLARLRGTTAMFAMAVRNTWRRRVRSVVTMLVVGGRRGGIHRHAGAQCLGQPHG